MDFLVDALFYAALSIGIAIGRWRAMPQRLTWLIQATILVLVGTLGFQLGTEGLLDTPYLVGESALFAVLLVAVTATIAEFLGRHHASRSQPGRWSWSSLWLPALILLSLVAGYLAGSLLPASPVQAAMTFEEADLLLLLFLVGWDIRLSWKAVRRAIIPITSAALGVAVLVPLVSLMAGTPWNVSAALLGAFGWYSLAGPLVGATLGPTLGLMAFLINFLRENFTMIGAPAIGRFSGAEGIAACGGATAMDTTLYFAIRYGGEGAGGVALSSGAVLTLLAPILLTLFLL
jgi:uncharacterized membrane protein YbjE (DUF340 family)